MALKKATQVFGRIETPAEPARPAIPADEFGPGEPARPAKAAEVVRPGVSITCQQMPFSEGFDVLALITSATPERAPNLQGSDESIGLALAWAAFRGILSDAPKLRKLCQLFGAYCTVKVPEGEDGLTPDKQAEVFGADYDVIAEWLWFCVNHNFGSLATMVPTAGKQAISAAMGRGAEIG